MVVVENTPITEGLQNAKSVATLCPPMLATTPPAFLPRSPGPRSTTSGGCVCVCDFLAMSLDVLGH
eukprot:1927650-Pyramimonas_sp.AAC.1